MEKDKKYIQYAAMINDALAETLFNEDSDMVIDQEVLMDNENLTQFIHALANVAPNSLFNRLTGDNKNHLQFNQLANSLCFQYMTKTSNSEEE